MATQFRETTLTPLLPPYFYFIWFGFYFFNVYNFHYLCNSCSINFDFCCLLKLGFLAFFTFNNWAKKITFIIGTHFMGKYQLHRASLTSAPTNKIWRTFSISWKKNEHSYKDPFLSETVLQTSNAAFLQQVCLKKISIQYKM